MICLNMIVKNEKHIIGETLDNLCKYIDFGYWVISDTGSTDGTQEYIKTYFNNKGIKGELFEDEWIDFASNRNKAMEHAFNKSDYLFFFDADDQINGNFKMPSVLDKDVYFFKFSNYDRICLINNREKIAKYEGVLHEHLTVLKQKHSSMYVDGDYLFVCRHLGDRSKTPNLYKKDAEILALAYENETERPNLKNRYCFYCAKSYSECGMIEESIQWYEKFLTLNADNQHKYCACINLGYIYPEKSLYYYELSCKYDPTRIEGITLIMEYYYKKHLHNTVNALWNKFKDYTVFECKNKIFLDKNTYAKFEWFNIVSGYYSNDHDGAYESCKRSIKNNFNLPNVLQNLNLYKNQFDGDTDNQIVKEFIIQNNICKDWVELNSVYKSNDFKKSNKILVYTGHAPFLWNDSTLKEKALGGSEKAVIYLTRQFPKHYEIYIAGEQLEEEIDNIKYVNASNLQKLLDENDFHTIIVSRYVTFFQDFHNIKCHNLLVWCHDTILHGSFLHYYQYIDYFVCLTKWQKDHYLKQYPFIQESKIKLINNGINVPDFARIKNTKIRNKFAWTSDSCRGLLTLVRMWPTIIETLPDATLDIASYNDFPLHQCDHEILNLMNKYPESIVHHGKLNKTDLYDLMSKAEYWLYTTDFAETSCITAMEMLMSGVICLYYPVAGLVDTLGDYGLKVEPGTELNTILELTEKEKREIIKNGKEYAMSCSWKNRACEWSNLIDGFYTSKERVRELHSSYSIPDAHVNFLKKLKEDMNFHPEVMYDIGSNVLHWTKEAKKIWPQGEIILFDVPKSFEFLYKEHGHRYHLGVLSDSDNKIVKYYQNTENPAGNSYYKEIGHGLSEVVYPENNYTEEKTMTLSSVTKNNNFPEPDLIKIDVQGAELDIMKGSIDIINKAKYLIVELQKVQYNKGAPLANKTIEYLENNGWELITETPFSDNGPDGDYCFKRVKRLGIFNSFPFHYEVFGFILNYANNNDYEVDIFTNTQYDMGWFDFYKSKFNNFNILNFDLFKGDSSRYDIFFVCTDDDPCFTFKPMDNVVCINHMNKIRKHGCKHYLNIANFSNSMLDYTFPCYPIVEKLGKKQNNVVTIVGGSILYIDTSIKIINRLYSNNKIKLNIICRNNTNFDFSGLNADKFEITYTKDVLTMDMINILKESSYILVDYYMGYDRLNGVVCSGSLPLALSTLCRPIISSEANIHWKINNALEFDIDSDDPINLDTPVNFESIKQEQTKYIDKFEKYCDKILDLKNSNFPKLMFQTWETYDIEPEFKNIINLWKKYNPDYTYMFFDKNERREFIKENFDENVLKTYDKILPGGAKSDLWKYCILYIHGGFSFDLDTLCMGKLDDLIHDDVDFIVPIDLNTNPTEGEHNLAAGFIGSVPRHPIFMEAINKIVKNVLNNTLPPSRLDFTGPGVLGRAVNIYTKRDETSSFKNKEGIRNNINFLHFDPETEYMKDITNNTIILQNKNKNQDIIRLYNIECSKIKDFKCWVSSKDLIAN